MTIPARRAMATGDNLGLNLVGRGDITVSSDQVTDLPIFDNRVWKLITGANWLYENVKLLDMQSYKGLRNLR